MTTAGASHQTGGGPTRQPRVKGTDVVGERRGFLRRIPFEPTSTVCTDASTVLNPASERLCQGFATIGLVISLPRAKA